MGEVSPEGFLLETLLLHFFCGSVTQLSRFFVLFGLFVFLVGEGYLNPVGCLWCHQSAAEIVK